MCDQSMFGVVLWTDAVEQKAVIWCEDHGSLAFYSQNGVNPHDGEPLDAGDLIHFDVCEEANVRIARNPQRIAQQKFTGLADRLKRRDPAPAQRTELRPYTRPAATAAVVSLSKYRVTGSPRLGAA